MNDQLTNSGQKSGETPENQSGPNIFNTLMVIILITFACNLIFSNFFSNNKGRISYSQFLALVENNCVKHVQLTDEEIQIRLRDDANPITVQGIINPEGKNQQLRSQNLQQIVFTTGKVENPELINTLRQYNVNLDQTISSNNTMLYLMASWVLPIILIYLVYFFIFRNMSKRMGSEGGLGGFMGVGKSKAKVYNVEKDTGLSFKDVAGQDEAKESLVEMVDFLHNPEKYHEIGAKQPKGALLVGPPGTGKTLLAKAVAGEAQVPFYHLTGSEFVEMFVGVGASRVRDLFETAKKNSPCIIFIDEIDAIGKRRDNQLGGNDEREQTLNQLLAEMDGFDTSKGIVVLAATNRPEILDKALLRAGRFDRRIIVEKPDLLGRESILKVHAEKVKLDGSVNLHDIALATSGATGADLANMINEGALRAVKMGRNKVSQEDLMEAVEVVIAGKEKKDRILNNKERKIVAYHEVGHALISALQKNTVPVQKITIVPRTMGSLGYTMNVPEEERYLMTREEILAQITVFLGGRAAEIIEFGDISTGAANDIERATQMARSMVTQYGMSTKFGSMGLASMENQYLDGRMVSTCSEQTNTLVDEEVRTILDDCQQSAVKLIEENKVSLDNISEYLLQKENISGEQFMQLLAESKKTA